MREKIVKATWKVGTRDSDAIEVQGRVLFERWEVSRHVTMSSGAKYRGGFAGVLDVRGTRREALAVCRLLNAGEKATVAK